MYRPYHEGTFQADPDSVGPSRDYAGFRPEIHPGGIKVMKILLPIYYLLFHSGYQLLSWNGYCYYQLILGLPL